MINLMMNYHNLKDLLLTTSMHSHNLYINQGDHYNIMLLKHIHQELFLTYSIFQILYMNCSLGILNCLGMSHNLLGNPSITLYNLMI
jgi:hypothetical protein